MTNLITIPYKNNGKKWTLYAGPFSPVEDTSIGLFPEWRGNVTEEKLDETYQLLVDLCDVLIKGRSAQIYIRPAADTCARPDDIQLIMKGEDIFHRKCALYLVSNEQYAVINDIAGPTRSACVLKIPRWQKPVTLFSTINQRTVESKTDRTLLDTFLKLETRLGYAINEFVCGVNLDK